MWSGSLLIGLTTADVDDSCVAATLPASAIDLQAKSTWLVRRSEVLQNGTTVFSSYCPSLERLASGDRIGVMYCADGTMHIFVNDCDFGIAASNIPQVCIRSMTTSCFWQLLFIDSLVCWRIWTNEFADGRQTFSINKLLKCLWKFKIHSHVRRQNQLHVQLTACETLLVPKLLG